MEVVGRGLLRSFTALQQLSVWDSTEQSSQALLLRSSGLRQCPTSLQLLELQLQGPETVQHVPWPRNLQLCSIRAPVVLSLEPCSCPGCATGFWGALGGLHAGSQMLVSLNIKGTTALRSCTRIHLAATTLFSHVEEVAAAAVSFEASPALSRLQRWCGALAPAFSGTQLQSLEAEVSGSLLKALVMHCNCASHLCPGVGCLPNF